MLVLGIETSCDETAAAVVAGGARRLSNVVLSQGPVHRLYGGIVPGLASREPLRGIVPIVRQGLGEAGVAGARGRPRRTVRASAYIWVRVSVAARVARALISARDSGETSA